jgi:regulator of RNase E activity RraA
LDELAKRFSALYTGAIVDILDRFDYRRQTLPPELSPLQPGMRLAGPAYPIAGKPHPDHDHDASIRRILTMLGAVPTGHVAVYQTEDQVSAHLGELSVTSLKSRGCAGAVINGGCRDIEFILREGFPVFARFTTPQDCVPRWELVSHGDAAIEIGGVRVAWGDYVVADRDGIVIIPAEAIADVLEQAEVLAATENQIREAVRAGMLPLEAYENYGTF